MSQKSVFAVIESSWDGIHYIELFSSQHLAKTEQRKLNKVAGFPKYEIKEMLVKGEASCS